MTAKTGKITEQEALDLHAKGRPGKLQISPTKPLATQRDLSLAYSPGVAVPCLKIKETPAAAYDYTARGNMVAIISNGTAVLGLGNLGALASKPVMEGKAVLFKRFADVDGIDLEVSTEDIDAFVNCVRYLGPSFGGINLEDIKAPECFVIEERLREIMDIPVFHDDQHGTAIISAAGILNALDLSGKSLKKVRLVVNGAGAAAIACTELLKSMGLPAKNIIMCDSKGVIHKGRSGLNQWKSAYAVETDMRTLADAMKGADVFLGLSTKGCVTQDMVASMAKKPVIFAMANPDPEITPEDAREVRSDAIIATGRSDYPNQVNNVLGFPYIFRGALDVRATAINEEMKIAAVHAIAELAREDVPDEVDAAYGGRRLRYGPDYIIPVPFDPRLITRVPAAVAKAAMESGVAQKPIEDFDAYRKELRARLDPTADRLEMIFEGVKSQPRRVVFAEGEEDRVIRAAIQFKEAGYGTPILVGCEEAIREKIEAMQLPSPVEIEIRGDFVTGHNLKFCDYLYKRHQRNGLLERDAMRTVHQNRNVFAALMVAMGEADAMVTGLLTRNFVVDYDDVRYVLDVKEDSVAMGISMAIAADRTLFMADTAVQIDPSAERLADIATEAANWAKLMGHTPRVAFLSFSNFGQAQRNNVEKIRDALFLLEARGVDFEFEGELSVDMALNYDRMKERYPFSRLTGAANVLVMPNLQSAHIASKLVAATHAVTYVGPVMSGFHKPVQIVRAEATVSDIITAAALAAFQVGR